MQGVGGQRLARGGARGAVQRPRPPQIDRISSSSTANGMIEIAGGGVPSRRRPQAATRMPPAST